MSLEMVADYINVERGIIPQDVCSAVLARVNGAEWKPNAWYDHNTGQEYSEDSLEPDLLYAIKEVQDLLNPSIKRAADLYKDKFTYKDSPRTTDIINHYCAVRFNRYRPGQIMRKHHDHIHALFDGKVRGIPVLSIVGNLNENYEGGELAFFDGKTKLALKTGDICMFPSCFLYPHEVLEVRKGERYSFASWAW